MAFTDRLYVRTYIPETQLGRVRPGSAARSHGRRVPGTDVPGERHGDLAGRRVHAEAGRDAARAREPGLCREGGPRRRLERAARPGTARGRAREGRPRTTPRKPPRSDPRREARPEASAAARRCAGSTSRSTAGELFALIGPDGAGKTTFFRIVAGLLQPTSGRVRARRRRRSASSRSASRLYEDLSVDENLALRARLYSVPPAEGRARAADLLARVGLDRFGARLAGALSGGMKQKLALVAALLTRPALLLLDEPTTGVDPVSRREFWQLLNAAPPRGAHDRRLDAVHGRGRVRHAPRVPRRAGGSSRARHARGDPRRVSAAARRDRDSSQRARGARQRLERHARGRRHLPLRDEAAREREEKRRERQGEEGRFLRR